MVEVREKVWKKVELGYFSIFPGSKIKTERGSAIIFLPNGNQVEMRPGTVLLAEGKDKIRLLQGQISFRIGSPESLSMKVGNLKVTKTPPLQVASAGMIVSSKNDAAIGTISAAPNGSVTIQNNEGHFIVSNQQQSILASLSPKESLRVPSTIVESPSKEKTQDIKVAQIGQLPPVEEAKEKYWGLPWWAWAAIGVGALAVGGVAIAASGGGGGGGGGAPAPICR